jgi:hypothetical protein
MLAPIIASRGLLAHSPLAATTPLAPAAQVRGEISIRRLDSFIDDDVQVGGARGIPRGAQQAAAAEPIQAPGELMPRVWKEDIDAAAASRLPHLPKR